MKLVPEFFKLIKEHEGLELTAYIDPVGVLTIGYGHTNATGNPPKVVKGLKITEQEANDILEKDLERYSNAVKKLVKVPINDNQYSALVSLCFNIGEGALAGSSVLRELNKKNYNQAADAFLMWNKGTVKGKKVVLPGLKRRRANERKLFLTGGTIPTPTPVILPEKPVQPLPDDPGVEPAKPSTGWKDFFSLLSVIFVGLGEGFKNPFGRK